MKKRRVTSPWGLGELPVTPVENKSGYETKREYLARLERGEREAAARAKEAEEAPRKAAVAEYSRNLVKLRKAQAENLFIVPSEELAGICQLAPESVEGSVEHITDQIRSAFEKMQRELASEGIILHASGLDKLKRIAQLNSGVDIRLVGTWRKIYEHASSLNALDYSDVTVPQPVQPVVLPESSEKKPSLDDLMNLRVTGSRDLAVAKEIADQLYESEMLPIYQQWVEHLVRDHNYHLTREDADIVEKWFQRNNRNRLRHESYNEVRRYMVLGIRRWPRS